MATTSRNRYCPDYLVHPGEILADHMEAYGMTQVELTDRTGLCKKTVNEIIGGKSSITPATAMLLEPVFSRPAHFWNNIESHYQSEKLRLSEIEKMRREIVWLKRFPVSAMTRLGWIERHSDPALQVRELLSFFGISSPERWEPVWLKHQVDFKQSASFEGCKEQVSAWLRKGEMMAHSIDCGVFDKNKFEELLLEARKLTGCGVEKAADTLRDMFAPAGAAVVVVPGLRKGVFGATRWIDGKAVIQLSILYKSNDHLWFTFFHEAGHILKHGRTNVFVEMGKTKGEKEDEANKFAAEILIPHKELSSFLKHGKPTLGDMESFAEKIGIATGIVVGRLQHDGIIPRNTGNGLKMFYDV